MKRCLKEWNWQRVRLLFKFLEESFNFTTSGWKILGKWKKNLSGGGTIPCRHAAAQFNQVSRKQRRAAALEISIRKIITAYALNRSNHPLKWTRQTEQRFLPEKQQIKPLKGWKWYWICHLSLCCFQPSPARSFWRLNEQRLTLAHKFLNQPVEI